jgi:hypothetical protein
VLTRSLGLLRQILPQSLKSHHRFGGLGPHGQSVEPHQLPPQDQPFRTHRILEYCDRVARWQPLRERRQRLQGHVMGPQ